MNLFLVLLPARSSAMFRRLFYFLVFTTDYPMLLRGVNIGGLGTLIASLASLISYKFYVQESEKNETAGTKGQYFRYFTVWNIVFAIVLLAVNVIV